MKKTILFLTPFLFASLALSAEAPPHSPAVTEAKVQEAAESHPRAQMRHIQKTERRDTLDENHSRAYTRSVEKEYRREGVEENKTEVRPDEKTMIKEGDKQEAGEWNREIRRDDRRGRRQIRHEGHRKTRRANREPVQNASSGNTAE